MLARRVEHLLDAVHVGGERRDDDPAPGGAEDAVQYRPDLALRRDEAGDLRVGRVGQQQVDALRAEPREPGQVGEPSVDRKLVHLEVAGVQDDAGAGADGDRERVRDRVVDREELQLERPQPLGLPLPDGQAERLDAPLGQLRLDQGEGELRPDDRNVVLVGEQVRHGPDVVLVPVGQHERLDVAEAVQDRREIRQDQVDPGLVDVGEEHPAVDDKQLAAVLEDGHVPPDGTEAAERDDAQCTVRQRAGQVALGVRERAGVDVGRDRRRSPAGRDTHRVGSGRSIPASAASTRSCAIWSAVASACGGRTGPPGRPRSPSAALTRVTPWARKIPVYSGRS